MWHRSKVLCCVAFASVTLLVLASAQTGTAVRPIDASLDGSQVVMASFHAGGWKIVFDTHIASEDTTRLLLAVPKAPTPELCSGGQATEDNCWCRYLGPEFARSGFGITPDAKSCPAKAGATKDEILSQVLGVDKGGDSFAGVVPCTIAVLDDLHRGTAPSATYSMCVGRTEASPKGGFWVRRALYLHHDAVKALGVQLPAPGVDSSAYSITVVVGILTVLDHPSDSTGRVVWTQSTQDFHFTMHRGVGSGATVVSNSIVLFGDAVAMALILKHNPGSARINHFLEVTIPVASDNKVVEILPESVMVGKDGDFEYDACSKKHRDLLPFVADDCYDPQVCETKAGLGTVSIVVPVPDGFSGADTNVDFFGNICVDDDGQFCSPLWVQAKVGQAPQKLCRPAETAQVDVKDYSDFTFLVGASPTQESVILAVNGRGVETQRSERVFSNAPLITIVSETVPFGSGFSLDLTHATVLFNVVRSDASVVDQLSATPNADGSGLTLSGPLEAVEACDGSGGEGCVRKDLVVNGEVVEENSVVRLSNFEKGSKAEEAVQDFYVDRFGDTPFSLTLADEAGPNLNGIMIARTSSQSDNYFLNGNVRTAHVFNLFPHGMGLVSGEYVQAKLFTYHRLSDEIVEDKFRRLANLPNHGTVVSSSHSWAVPDNWDGTFTNTTMRVVFGATMSELCIAARGVGLVSKVERLLSSAASDFNNVVISSSSTDPEELDCTDRRSQGTTTGPGLIGSVSITFYALMRGFNATLAENFEGVIAFSVVSAVELAGSELAGSGGIPVWVICTVVVGVVFLAASLLRVGTQMRKSSHESHGIEDSMAKGDRPADNP